MEATAGTAQSEVATSGRRLIVLSDGTWNGASSPFRTNVWRLYEGLDLTAEQVVLYDDGVGASPYKPLRWLGGAFGFGLKRNVLELYTFLSRHYHPNDDIYLFGFSRGAFTVRVLVEMIGSQGLVKGAERHDDLPRLAAWAYRAYRRGASTRTQRAFLFVPRSLRDWLFKLRDWLRRLDAYDGSQNHKITDQKPITFLGVWDTVDAYGVPVDELAQGINWMVWPLRLSSNKLTPLVGRACHALAINEERQTFRPVLWDEAGEQANRISQVWFAGVHADLGGGYPDDRLSLVSLNWMVLQAQEKGLTFLPSQLAKWTESASSFAALHDSRKGLALSYRYGPRQIPGLGVKIALPKIHVSVFDRIRRLQDYAPLNIPTNYAVVNDTGDDQPPNQWSESDVGKKYRASEQKKLEGLVRWRQVVYFFAVGILLFLVLRLTIFPTRRDDIPTAGIYAKQTLGIIIREYVPQALRPGLEGVADHPEEVLVSAGLVSVLIGADRWLKARIDRRMRRVWDGIRAGQAPEASKSGDPGTIQIGALGLLRWLAGIPEVAVRYVGPVLVGLLCWFLIFAIINRMAFEIRNMSGLVCNGRAEKPEPPGLQKSVPVEFEPRNLCRETVVTMERGAQYRMELFLPPDWKDRSSGPIPIGGLSWRSSTISPSARALYFLASPYLRVWRGSWLIPVARIGPRGDDHYLLAATKTEFTARKDGQLFLFANDAVSGLGVGDGLLGCVFGYCNNTGSAARVTVTKLAEPGQPRVICQTPDVACEDDPNFGLGAVK